jgi:hypothetical protein
MGHSRWCSLGLVCLSLFVGLAGCQGQEGSPPGVGSEGGEDIPPVAGSPSEPGGPVGEELPAPPPSTPNPEARPDIVSRENQLPGTPDWRIKRTANRREIEGYALVATVTPGQRVPVAVSASEARNFRWFVYRLGHYGGQGRERWREAARFKRRVSPSVP